MCGDFLEEKGGKKKSQFTLYASFTMKKGKEKKRGIPSRVEEKDSYGDKTVPEWGGKKGGGRKFFFPIAYYEGERGKSPGFEKRGKGGVFSC